MEARWCGAACASAITATYTGSRSTAASGLSDSGIFKTNGAGAAGQIIGQRELVFGDNEKFILQPGEGLGFYLNYLAGDIDQYVKIYVEWDEESSAPSSQGEYLIDVGPVPGNTGTSYNYASFFNPATSGKTAIINHIGIRIDSVAAATSVPMRLRRTTAASGGTQITAANIPKKHTSTADSAMEIRRTGVTVTYVGTNAEQFVALQTPTTVGAATAPSVNAYQDLAFVNEANEPIVLRPGEGIALHHDTFPGDADFRVKLLISWEEVAFASTPAVENEYLMSTGPVLGSLSSGYVYSTFFNPVSSGKDFSIKKIGIKANRRYLLAGAGYIPLTIRPITAASGGTLLTAANIPKKNASTTTTTAEIRNDNVTATLGQDTATRLMGVTIPGAVNQIYGDWEQYIYSGDDLILKPGQGLALYQESSAGDQSLLMHFIFEWAESDVSAPADSLTFSISDNAVGFGTLSASAARYATGDGTGSGTETVAHTVTASTNASSGYAITIQGATLTSGANTITSIGGASTASTVGTEQFGIRITASGGDGAVVSPYNHATDYAYDATGSVSDIIASDADGDDVETTYSVRYIGNINAATEAGTYTSSITYVITANF